MFPTHLGAQQGSTLSLGQSTAARVLEIHKEDYISTRGVSHKWRCRKNWSVFFKLTHADCTSRMAQGSSLRKQRLRDCNDKNS